VRHILIILSFLLLSSPVIGQSSKYESVSQCVLQTMTEKKLTGNKMFEMVKEECERSLGRLEDKKRGVLYWGKRNGKYGWEEDGDEKKNSKYVGEVKYGIPYGQGTLTYLNGNKYVGEFKVGLQNGQGTETFPDGSKYVGEWKNGKHHGQGTYTFHDGVKWVGVWIKSEPWNITKYDKDGKIYGRKVNGVRQ